MFSLNSKCQLIRINKDFYNLNNNNKLIWLKALMSKFLNNNNNNKGKCNHNNKDNINIQI